MDEKPESSENSLKSSLPTIETSDSSIKSSSSASRTPKKKISDEFSEDAKSESTRQPKKKQDAPEVFKVPSDLTKSSIKENEPQESELHSIVIETDRPEQKPESKEEISEPPKAVPDTSKGPSEEVSEPSEETAQPSEPSEETAQPSEESTEPPEEAGASSAGSEDTEEKGKRPSYFKRKQASFVRFLTGKAPGEGDEEEKSPKPAKPARPSFVRRKLMALEDQLSMSNINRGVARIFRPEEKKSEQGDAEDPDKEQSAEAAGPTHLSSGMACLMLIAITTGQAMTTLPHHLNSSSWYGVFLNVWLGVNAMYAGLCTGWCWTAMEERWPEYLEYSRIPYQDIAYRASGSWTKYIVAILIDVSVLGTSGVYILVMAGVIENLVIGKLHFCHLTMIIAVCLVPFIMFGSFRNVRFIGFIDVLMSFLFVLLIIVLFFLEKPSIGRVDYSDPHLNAVVEAFAGFSYAYGSGGVIPSVLSDMEDRRQFTYSLVTAYMVCIALYTILPVLGYAAYGENTPRYILKSILKNNEADTIRYYLSVVIVVVHFLQMATTFVLAFFPTLHAFEVRVNCPDKFGLYRLLVRTIIWICLLIVILGVPSMPHIMDLIGATTLNVTTYILPPIFYVCLVCSNEDSEKRCMGKKEWLLILETVFIGLVVLIVCTFVAIQGYGDFGSSHVSCYLNSTILKG